MLTIGLYTDTLGELSFQEMLDWCALHGVESIELGTGNFSGAPHCNVKQLLSSEHAREDMLGALSTRGIRLAALNCSGNLLDADDERRRKSQQVFYDSVLLTEKLGLDTLVLMSGCPGEPGDAGHYPNWVTTYWQREYQDLLAWQWKQVVIPFWSEAIRHCVDHRVRLAFEMHPGQVVYNPRTFNQLREIGGPTFGINLDPSHLFWQGIDPLIVIQELGKSIYHVHAKDCRMDSAEISLNGVLETRVSGTRAWEHCLPGEGHPESFWRDFISALEKSGYDRTLAIEYAGPPEYKHQGIANTVTFLNQAGAKAGTIAA